MANFISEILDRVLGRKRQKPGKTEKQTWLIPPASSAAPNGSRNGAATSRDTQQSGYARAGQTNRQETRSVDVGLIPPKPTKLSSAHENARRAAIQSRTEAQLSADSDFPAVELVPPTRKTPPQPPMSRDEQHRLRLRDVSGQSSSVGANGLIPPQAKSAGGEAGKGESSPAPMLRLRQRDRV